MMLTISKPAVQRTFGKLHEEIERRPDFQRQLHQKGASNAAIVGIIREAFPVADPEVVRTHGRVLEGFERPEITHGEIGKGSIAMMHLWYNALKEEERLTGQRVPQLRRERVDQLLPHYLIPPGRAATFEAPDAETQHMKQFLDIARAFTYAMGGGPEGSTVEAIFFYPLFVLGVLLNDAKAS